MVSTLRVVGTKWLIVEEGTLKNYYEVDIFVDQNWS
jgi:hypothetical protein